MDYDSPVFLQNFNGLQNRREIGVLFDHSSLPSITGKY